ncbi:MAG: cyclic nucleotide-binding domain-containing protein [Myxococcota bacterium]|nr:cyclic nucleotide-binding domain-containing protein [Myxococcota bacterium]
MSLDDLKAFPLLAELDESEREAVSEALEELRLDAGTLLFDEGEESDGLLFVAEGAVRIESSRAGEGVDVGPGASLGAFSLVARGEREARAETTSRSRILVLRRHGFGRLRDESPRAACRLLEAVVRETARLSRAALGRPG